MRKVALCIHQYPEALDHGVRQQLPRHLFGDGMGAFRIALGQLKLDHLSRPHFPDIAEPQGMQRVTDRLALRVQPPGFSITVTVAFTA